MAITPGGELNSVPASQKQTLDSNYIDFTSATTKGWAQQYLPDLMEKEAEVYGKRTISGFLAQVGAEEAMSSDRVVWSEQGRLHLSYKGTVITASSGLVEIDTDIDGLAQTTTHGIRVGDTVVLSSATKTLKCYVSVAARGTSVGTNDRITCLPYAQAALNTGSTFADSDAISIFVYGSEFSKGVDGQNLANEPSFKSFENKPIILKDTYIVSGSDASSIAPCLSNSANIASNSAKSVEALTPVTPEDSWPLEVIAANKPSVPTEVLLTAKPPVASCIVELVSAISDSNIDISK